MKLSTPVIISRLPVQLGLSDRVTVLGSCFADSMGRALADGGFDVMVNPFGTLYNPVSIANSVARLDHGIPFSGNDCVQMGAGAGLICSWWHHTSFARATEEEFLGNANSALEHAAAFWKDCNKVIVTLGTAMVWKLVSNGEVVSNCLKRPAAEFSHEMLPPGTVSAVLQRLVESHPDKEFIFTVSPIRHLSDGAQGNSVSKAVLTLACDALCERFKERVCYFPSYEIMLDELRDYRFYAEDMVHPSAQAALYIADRFIDAGLSEDELPLLEPARKKALRDAHRALF